MGNSQSTKQTSKTYNEMVTKINNEMTTNFSNSFTSEQQNTCMSSIDQLISVDGDIVITGNGNTIENKATVNLECMLNKTSTKDLQQNIANSLTAAVEKVLGNDTMNKVDQEAKTQLGSFVGNNNNSDISTDIQNKTITDVRTAIKTTVENKVTDKVIQEAKTFMKQVIQTKKDLIITGDNNSVRNQADSFLKAGVISKEINTIVNAVMNTNAVTEKIDVQNKIVNDTTQKATSTGFAEIFESVGKMFSSIFTGLMGPGIIIVVVIILVIIMKSMMGGQSQGQQGYPQQGYPSSYIPQGYLPYPPQQLPPLR
jgi:hypothetical protein